jgi:S1-C subfamily serine protease
MRFGLVLICTATLTACSGSAQEQQHAAKDRYVEMYRTLHPSVVLFTMHVPSDDPRRKGKFDDAYGTGFVVASGTWGTRILTDAHVVADSHNLVARIGDKKSAPAHVIATSNEDDDVAIVETAIPNSTVAELGTSRAVEPGSAIGVLGYPIPDAFEDERLGTTVSLYTGRIASVRRGALELDVPIIPGESGGPVFDAQTGKVIGIAESRFDEERAIGFATPIDVAVKFLAAHKR